jgi:hypothetical protein
MELDEIIVCGVNSADNIYYKDNLDSGNWNQL